MSSYDQPQEYVSMDEFRETMKLVRLQVAIPVSALGTTIVCSVVIKHGIDDISALHPTLLMPNSHILGAYASVFFALERLCLLLTLARSQETKETLVRGVGLRLAAANWILSGWAVCWTLQWFLGAAILIAVNFLIILSCHFTLWQFTPSLRKPLTAIFVHTPVSLFVALLLTMMLHSGSVALHWVITKRSNWDKWVWPAVAALLTAHGTSAVWECLSLQYVLAAGNQVLAVAILVASPRTDPSLPDSARPKPPPVVFTLIGILVLHPLALALGLVIAHRRRAEGRIRLEEEVEAADERVRAAEADREAARQAAAAAGATA